MNSELAYIHSQCRGQELFRAAQQEHRFDVAASHKPTSDRGQTIVKLRIGDRLRALAIRRPRAGAEGTTA